MFSRVFITGTGVISSLGRNTEENLQALLKGASGTGVSRILKTIHRELPVSEVKFTNEELVPMSGLSSSKPLTRTTLLGMIAAREAFDSARLDEVSKLRMGFISGTSVGGMRKTEDLYLNYLSQDTTQDQIAYIDTHDCGDSTQTIADKLKANAYVTTISTACSSAANALMLGARLIRNNILDRVIAGGVDSLTRFTLNGFNTLLILDKEPCKPFDQNRQGLNLGEAAGFLVLESERAAKAAGRTILGELKGFANTNDAFHQTASSPEGEGAFLAMKKALDVAGLSPKLVDYINVHGTGTLNNDLSEGKAMEKLFDDVPRFSSTKAFTGHTLGAAGGIEAVFSILSLREQVIFPNLNFSVPMQEINFHPVTLLERNAGIQNILSNSFGFGGNNTALVFSQV